MKLQAHPHFIHSDIALKLFGHIKGVMSNHPFNCSDSDCSTKIALYRQCPVSTCKLEVGYCKEHGGDDRAFEAMTTHIQAHKDKDTQS